jgi:hypothetical protein
MVTGLTSLQFGESSSRRDSAQDCPGAAEMGPVGGQVRALWRPVEWGTKTGVDLSLSSGQRQDGDSLTGPTSGGERSLRS